MSVEISDELALDLLLDELDKWHPDDDVRELYSKYYEENLRQGIYCGSEFNPMSIVDNDWVNWTSVITKSEFSDYDIKDEDDEKILCKHNNLYLIVA